MRTEGGASCSIKDLGAQDVGIRRANAYPMPSRCRYLAALLLVAGTGCEKELVNDTPDAAVDAVPLPPGNFACVGVDWPTHVKDPFPVSGAVANWQLDQQLGGVTVEIHDAGTDAMLTQTTSSAGALNKGKWAASIATGGVAQRIYRKFSSAGYMDSYAYDAFPEFQEFAWGISLVTQTELDGFFQMSGMSPDPSLGVMWVEVWDCYPPGTAQIKPVAGATFEAPPGAKIVYYDGPKGNFDASLTSTTDTWAGALIVGVQPGLTDVVVHAGPLTYRSWPVMVRANAITFSPRHP